MWVVTLNSVNGGWYPDGETLLLHCAVVKWSSNGDETVRNIIGDNW